jgi:hypothetical protein
MLVMLVVGFGVPIVAGGDWMPNMRLLGPYVPVLYLFVVVIAGPTLQRGALALVAVMAIALSVTATLPLRDGGNLTATDVRFDDVGRALEHTGLGQRVVATAVLGRMAFDAPDVRITDILGLTEPTVARTHEPGSVYGKTNYAYTMSLRPAVIATNDWIPLQSMLAAGGPTEIPYEAVVSDRLLQGPAFLLADPLVADRLAQALDAEGDRARIETIATAFGEWTRMFPGGL